MTKNKTGDFNMEKIIKLTEEMLEAIESGKVLVLGIGDGEEEVHFHIRRRALRSALEEHKTCQ
jgi:hypothetical protein